MRSVTVKIAGHRLALRTDADEAYVRGLADQVNKKIHALRAGTHAAGADAIALTAALQLADELARERQKMADLKEKVRDKSRSIQEYIRKEAKL
jgi:cell division protein ZapA (FtsZ GTPase activity inhibitor)